MLKALLIAELQEDLTKILEQVSRAGNIEIIRRVLPGAAAISAINTFQPDIILTSSPTANILNNALEPVFLQPRLNVMASTHQGIQLVGLEDVYYFQADDKYVTAHHKNGELLIEDTISSLEREFAAQFIRIHRKTLVSVSKIERLFKNETGQHFISIKGKKINLPVSRRQLSKVRDVLLCK